MPTDWMRSETGISHGIRGATTYEMRETTFADRALSGVEAKLKYS
jgi:hypothetical protein